MTANAAPQVTEQLTRAVTNTQPWGQVGLMPLNLDLERHILPVCSCGFGIKPMFILNIICYVEFVQLNVKEQFVWLQEKSRTENV